MALKTEKQQHIGFYFSLSTLMIWRKLIQSKFRSLDRYCKMLNKLRFDIECRVMDERKGNSGFDSDGNIQSGLKGSEKKSTKQKTIQP